MTSTYCLPIRLKLEVVYNTAHWKQKEEKRNSIKMIWLRGRKITILNHISGNVSDFVWVMDHWGEKNKLKKKITFFFGKKGKTWRGLTSVSHSEERRRSEQWRHRPAGVNLLHAYSHVDRERLKNLRTGRGKLLMTPTLLVTALDKHMLRYHFKCMR